MFGSGLAAEPLVLECLLGEILVYGYRKRVRMRATNSASSSLLRVRLQQCVDEVFGVVGDILPVPLMKDDLCTRALLDQILKVFGAEWAIAAEKGVGYDAQGPHVDWLAVTLLEHDLWGGVAEGASHGGKDFILCIEHLRDAEVGEDKVGVRVGSEVEEVLRLEICDQSISSMCYDDR